MNRSNIGKIIFAVVLILIILVISIPIYFIYYQKEYNWYEDFELNLDYNGSTIIVSQYGDGDFTNITDAIDIASDGDIVKILSGTYNLSHVIRKRIKIIGEGDTTIIRPGNEDYILWISRDVDGVTVEKLNFTTQNNHSIRYAIYMQSNKSIIKDCNYQGRFEYVIRINDAEKCMVTSNTIRSDGYEFEMGSYSSGTGIILGNCEKILIKGNTIENFTKFGIYFETSVKCAITENQTSDCWTGVYLYEGKFHVVIDNAYSNNIGGDVDNNSWKPKIEENEDVNIDYGDPQVPWVYIIIPMLAIVLFFVLIISINIIVLIIWTIKKIRSKMKIRSKCHYGRTDRNMEVPKKERPTLEKGDNKKLKFVKFSLSTIIAIFSSVLILFAIISIFFIGIADFEGEKYLCCLAPLLLPVIFLGLVFFGIILIGNLSLVFSHFRKK